MTTKQPSTTPTRKIIRCDECTEPVLEHRNGMLIIRAKHRGVSHITMVHLNELRDKLGITPEDVR